MSDLISRQAVKNIMFNHRGVDIYKNNDKKTKRYATIDLDDFDAIPSVKLEPNKGYWIKHGIYGDQYNANYIYKCSFCGRTISDSTTDFCPYCGADMTVKGD